MESLNQIQYPHGLAPRGDTVDEYSSPAGGQVKVSDPYRFLEDPDAEDTKKWVAAQNEISQNYFAQCDQRDKLKVALTECWNYAKRGLSCKHGSNYYFRYNTGLQNQAVMYKILEENQYKTTEGDDLAGTKVFIDPNTLAADGTASLGSTAWSEDGKFMAYNINLAGSDWATIRVRDASTCADVETDVLKWVKFSGADWTKDSKGFFYSKFDAPESIKEAAAADASKAGKETEKLEFQKVYYHRVGTTQDQDVLVYENKDEASWMFSISVTEDGKYAILDTRKDCDDLGLVAYADISGNSLTDKIEFTPIINDWIGGFSYIYNIGPIFYFKTNYKASKSKVISINIEYPGEENWIDVIPEHESNVLQSAECINGKIVAYYLECASDKMKVFEYGDNGTKAKEIREIPLPDIGTVAGSFGKHDSSEFMFKFTSFTDPGSSWRVNMDTFQLERVASTKLGPSCGDISDFITDQVFYPSKDGTLVPMFVVRRKDVLPDMNTTPGSPLLTLLYGYGGFNISLTPMFSPSKLVFMNNMRGLFCVANLRGGGEYGEEWHKAGTKDKKQNVFDDFIAAAEYLTQKKLTDNKSLIINGGSNGGTLTTACANQRPDLYAGMVSQVPVTDMLRFQKFTIGHFWCSDFGNADDGGVDYLLKYSPLHNIKEQKYPAMLVTTADHDDRVVPLHTFKYMAELQHTAGQGTVPGQSPLLTRIDVNAGHGAGMPTEKLIEQMADLWGFVAKVTGRECIVDEQTLAQSAKPQEVTIFDKIVAKEIPATIIYEDDICLAFRDINAVAQTHFLVIPKNRQGLSQLCFATDSHAALLGHLMVVVAKTAKQEGLDKDGYRVVINDGKNGCQTVFHLHIHVIGGQQLSWPPGV